MSSTRPFRVGDFVRVDIKDAYYAARGRAEAVSGIVRLVCLEPGVGWQTNKKDLTGQTIIVMDHELSLVEVSNCVE